MFVQSASSPNSSDPSLPDAASQGNCLAQGSLPFQLGERPAPGLQHKAVSAPARLPRRQGGVAQGLTCAWEVQGLELHLPLLLEGDCP